MKRIYAFAFVALGFVVFGCNNPNRSASMGEVVLEDIASTDMAQIDAAAAVGEQKLLGPETMKGNFSDDQNPENQTAESIVHQQKKIIRSGNLSIESKDIQKTRQNLDALVKKNHGYYEEENTSAGSTYTNYNLILRIPSHQFDQFIQALESGSDRITEKSIKAQDISIQYFDVESRLKSKRSYLQRYQNMVSSAKSVKELLEIEEQIRQLQEDIESSESLLRNLSGQVNYSTLNVHIYYADASSSAYSNSYISKIKNAFGIGWELISSIFLGIITIWPILILFGLIIWAWKRFRNRKKVS